MLFWGAIFGKQKSQLSKVLGLQRTSGRLNPCISWLRFHNSSHFKKFVNCLYINYQLDALIIHKIIFSSTCFEPQMLIFRRIQLYTCSIWYCHPLGEFLVACRYTAWVRTDRPPGTLVESDSTISCMYTIVSSWRLALEARNM